MNADLIKWISHLSILVAAALGGCYLMMEEKRSPLALSILFSALVLVGLCVIQAPGGGGRTWMHTLVSRYMLGG